MAAPAFVSATAQTGNATTAPSVTLPTTAANDILILVAVNGGANTAITPGGTYNGGAWTQIGGGGWTSGWGGNFWSRCTGNHSGQTVTYTSTDSASALVVRISGAATIGSPIDVSTGATLGAVAGGALTGFTTTVADALVVYTGAVDDNQTISAPTKNAVAMSNLSTASSTGGADSAVWYANSAQAVAGATGNFAITNAAGTAQGKRVAAYSIKPQVAPTYVQTRFRGRGDTIALNTNNFTHAVNTDFSQNVNETFRIRIAVEERSGPDPAVSFGGQLECRLNAGTWQNVTTTSSVLKAVPSAMFADGDATTDLLANDLFPTFVAGHGSETGDAGDVALSLAHTEHEFALQIVGADVANNDLIDVRLLGATAAPGPLLTLTAVEATQTPLGGISNTDTTAYAGGLGAEPNTSTYGATTLGAQESSANSYPP